MNLRNTTKTLALAGVFIALTFSDQAVSANTTAAEASPVLDAAPNGFSIQFEQTIQATPKQVYQALTQDIGQWWLAAHTWYGSSANMTLAAKAGGCFCEIAAEGRETEHMRVVKVEPNQLIRLSGGLGPLQGEGLSGVMDWQIQSTSEDLVTLRVSYRVGGYSPNDLSAWAAPVATVLQQQMRAMQTFVEAN
ncbi:SRPBCC family protein [Pseudidiomarina aestuarii]|nr:SRPBCC family protein [Pseudidiomarina aestuarii]